eukprot:9405374-Lingulodinium_polyedra.AAC.1
MQSCPVVSWSVHGNDHHEAVVAHVQQSAAMAFSRHDNVPRKQHVSENTWHMIALRKLWRKQFVHACNARQFQCDFGSQLWGAFAVWRAAT